MFPYVNSCTLFLYNLCMLIVIPILYAGCFTLTAIWRCFIARLAGGALLFFLSKKVGKKDKTLLNSLTAQTQNRHQCTWLKPLSCSYCCRYVLLYLASYFVISNVVRNPEYLRDHERFQISLSFARPLRLSSRAYLK
jgi:hypothetical protein